MSETFEFFTVCTKLAEMAILYSKDLTTAKKKLPPVGLDLMLQIIAGLGVQCHPFSDGKIDKTVAIKYDPSLSKKILCTLNQF